MFNIEWDGRIYTALPAQMVVSSHTALTGVAGQQCLNRDPVTDIDPPTSSGGVTNGFNNAQRFMTRNMRHGHAHTGLELLAVGAADAAGLNTQQRSAVRDRRDWYVERFKRSRCGQRHGQGCFCCHRNILKPSGKWSWKHRLQ